MRAVRAAYPFAIIPLAVDLGEGPIGPLLWFVIALVVFWLSIVVMLVWYALRRDCEQTGDETPGGSVHPEPTLS